MKRIVFLCTCLLVISTLLPSTFISYANERSIADGVYQVELSFLSEEVAGQGVLFDKKAVLTVREGRQLVAVKIKPGHVMTSVAVTQQGENMSTSLRTAESLVQFDIKSTKQKFVLAGTYKKPTDNKEVVFSQILMMNENSLPATQPIPSASDESDKLQHLDRVSFTLLTYGTEERSVMNEYVEPYMKIFKRGNRYYAHMQITKSAWITDITVEQKGEMMEPKVVSHEEPLKTIEFEIEDFQKKSKLWVEVNLPELTYSYNYFVDLSFDQAQVKPYITQSGQAVQSQAKSSMAKRSEEPAKPLRPARVTKPVEKEDIPVETIPEAAPEENLEFDRTLDEVVKEEPTEIAQVASEPVQEEIAAEQTDELKISMDVMKVMILTSLCGVSAVLFIRRLISRRKTSMKR
ncbi:hypothetical protein DV702_13430 [Sporosarcina sp. PTS2304]|uniref:NEAT domain-containing protein n=1 Tax=Sporosarcina sp. PTS2304 TaxID=2283194 RepID=UPI000E0D13E3|nr:NEAT domain-containing protein [Sporosarcina sp. PTS2304]AXI00634.1 hypothetical protein DV702_13430 [Sporosarcina sp. PTS2304]